MRLASRVAIALGIAAGALIAPHAAHAEAPQTSETTVVFPGIDPCTGAHMTVTIDLQVRQHRHGHNMVTTYTSSGGSTDTGYILRNSGRTTMINGNTIVDRLVEQWAHPDGRRFRVQLVAVIDASSGVPRVLRTPPDTLRCIGAPNVI